MKRKKQRLTYKQLLAIGIPSVLIPGLLLASTLGWKGNPLTNVQNYHEVKEIFPHRGNVLKVYDGDTFQLTTGHEVRLIGVNAPDRGKEGFKEALGSLESMVKETPVYLEYDRYQDDKYGRILAWVWIGCEGNPNFLPHDYMHDTNNRSKPGLRENPKNCNEGMLVNEELAKQGYVQFVTYKDRGELKYGKRIQLVVSGEW